MKQLTKKEFEKLYLSKTNKEVCKELNISTPILFKLLKENGIKLKGRQNSNRNRKKLIIV